MIVFLLVVHRLVMHINIIIYGLIQYSFISILLKSVATLYGFYKTLNRIGQMSNVIFQINCDYENINLKNG